MIDISNMYKDEVLAALYNASQPQGMGMLHYDPKPMTTAEACAILDDMPVGRKRFDYLKGRIMKVDLSGDSFNPNLYDRDNGQGAAARALAGLKAS